ncbi:phosphoribosylamine--glycine ligase [Candidatus Woesearchaeota archaeon]|nr:phosphoribosylamine--glycine ligase [Candidatus Woesearchaeota archaeon]
MKILLMGNGAREHVIAESLKKNKDALLYSFMKSRNPGIASLSKEICMGSYSDLDAIKKFARKNEIDFAFVGPEEPLSFGVVDSLIEIGVPSIGPTRLMARLETSKSFTRELLKKYKIEGNPKFRAFNQENFNEIKYFFNELEGIVIKPDGLTSGKGVKVQGDHFDTKDEALDYCKEVLETHKAVVVEEKLDGEEFSLQCLTDGKTVIATPPVQDHKRAYENDEGSNTGGMGSYSCENHLLPFLKKGHIDKALGITQKVADAIYRETGLYYKGVMYGGFILTKKGIKLLEYNARFGDPEAMNVLNLLKTDLASICYAMNVQKLSTIKVEFEKKATVCKYVVPEGYPDNPIKNEKIEITKVHKKAKMYYASVEQRGNEIYMTGSRAIAFLGIGNNLDEAENIAEDSVYCIKGRVFHRKDIGTKALIEKRVNHVKSFSA